MTRKDFELIAAAINRAAQRADNEGEHGTVYDLACDLAGELTKTNPKFDQRRFLVACGVEV
ncbi:hypothetical protein [Aquibium microcysteis]|uniref:hypothetical protein n=1 Tax=Aquibium microcysteis TaxID=675281 RepID=UPI00165D0879|nr:hypothetical protein [Aquibium microcysteis]